MNPDNQYGTYICNEQHCDYLLLDEEFVVCRPYVQANGIAEYEAPVALRPGESVLFGDDLYQKLSGRQGDCRSNVKGAHRKTPSLIQNIVRHLTSFRVIRKILCWHSKLLGVYY